VPRLQGAGVTRPPDPLVQALTDRRAELGISLSEVAYRRGLARYPGHLVRVESGELSPTLAVLRSWADALGCDLMLVPREAAD